VIGDYGAAGSAEQHVSTLVHGWAPDYIVTLGDNNYPNGAASTIDANIGQYYHDFIAPYGGKYGAGAATNKFWPALGNEDYNSSTGYSAYLNYFHLPNNERYYDVTLGPVKWFFVNSDYHEPDGYTSTSVQAQWLQKELAASTATWKIVVLHQPPYSSSWAQTDYMRWPFQAWGATAVMSGHSHTYERLFEDNQFPYFVNGLGGGGRDNFSAPVPGSQVRYNGDYGATLLDAQPDHLTFQFVGAWDHPGQVIDSYTIYTQPSAQVPAAPSGLSATAASSGQVNLAWTDNSSNEDQFNIQRSTDGVNFSPLATVGRNVTSYSDTGLRAGTRYYYRVLAHNLAGDSAWSGVANVTLPAAGVATHLGLSAPANSTAGAAFGVTVTALDVNNNPAAGYTGTVHFTSSDGQAVLPADYTFTAADAGAHTFTGGVTLKTTGSQTVTVTDRAGSSITGSAGVTVTSPAAPAVPSGLTATAVSGNQVDLSWADNSNPPNVEETGFKLYRSTDQSTWTWFAVTGQDVTSYSWYSGTAGSTYYFRVTAYDSAGESAPSSTVTVTMPTVPVAPSNLAVTAVSANQMNLSWADNSNPPGVEETGFKLYRSTDQVNWTWFAVTGQDVTSYSWYSGTAGTTYYFRVTAYNAAGDSAPSNTAVVTTPVVPAAPSGLTATAVSATQVNLAWTDNSNPPGVEETGFKLYRSTDQVNWTWFAVTGQDVTTYSWYSGVAGTTYYFRVTAYNAAGDSVPSSTASATTAGAPAPSAPAGITTAAPLAPTVTTSPAQPLSPSPTSPRAARVGPSARVAAPHKVQAGRPRPHHRRAKPRRQKGQRSSRLGPGEKGDGLLPGAAD
jgi:hypothetical protein